MRLRPRQSLFVERSLAALCDHGNTLSIASTGFGKTIALSAVVAKSLEGSDAKACILAHRDELTAQNRAKFGRVAPDITTSVVDAEAKSWAGRATFAMVPTLSRPANLAAMPALDLLVIDEAHHAVADSYRRIIDHVRGANPDCRIFGVTATPNRGDRKGLRDIFDNVGDQVRLSELIASGHLVPPRTFVIDVGVQEQLRAVRKSAADYDMTEVAQIMNRAPVTDEVVRHWQEKASERPTVVFCSTVAHAENVTAAFNGAGVSAAVIHGDLDAGTRRRILSAYASGEIRVIVNVAVLTEGWDHPPTSCVVLLRPSSYKSTMIQMVGRGLRTVDPEEHPGVVKTDCIVLDFGTSSLIHGTLEQDVDLDGKTETGEAPTKTCPACEAEIPLAAMESQEEIRMSDLTFATRPHEAIPALPPAVRSGRTLLALDLGTTTGWALHGMDGLITSGTVSFRPGRFDGGGMRYLRFTNWLGELDRLSGPIASIWFEEVRRHVGTDAAHVYGGLMATLTAWAELRGVPYEGVPVGTIKRHATGKGNADKAAMIAAARARGFSPADDNEADAIAILFWALETKGGLQ